MLKALLRALKLLSIGVVGYFLLINVLELKSYKSESYIRSKVIQLQGNNHSCSGTQIKAPSGKDYILTAGHCSALIENGVIYAKDDKNSLIPRHIVEEDKDSDLLLLEGLPNLSGLSISNSLPYKQDQLRAFTHGYHYETFKSVGELIQEAKIEIPLFVIESSEQEAQCQLSKYRIVDDAVSLSIGGIKILSLKGCELYIDAYYSQMIIAPGSSGGTVVDSNGDLVGVAFAGDSSNTFAFIVPLESIKSFLKSY